MYLETCYYSDAILLAPMHRDDMSAVLLLLQQIKFDLGYVRKREQQEQAEIVELMKKLSKSLIQYFMVRKSQLPNLDTVCFFFHFKLFSNFVGRHWG